MNDTRTSSRTRSIAYVGLSIALIAVSAWITVPIGPVPFTLQMLSISFVIYALRPSQAIATIYGYVILGVIGVPVFSGMRGGIGVILGPTGGFIDGYLLGVPLAVGLLYLVERIREKRRSVKDVVFEDELVAVDNASLSVDGTAVSVSGSFSSSNGKAFRRSELSLLATVRNCGWGIVACFVFVAVSYTIGVIQYTFVAHVGVEVALAACVIPFIVPDIVKVLLGVACAQAVDSAVGIRSRL